MRRLALAILILLPACKRPDGARDGVAMSVDSSGAFPRAQVTGEPATWTLDTVAVLTDSGASGFGRVRGTLLDADGTLWVVDAGGRAIHRFGRDGRSLGIAGREGGGPGEYRDPYSLGALGHDVALYDPGNGRVMRMTRDWTLVAEWPVGSRLTGSSDIRFHPGGWLMQYARSANGGSPIFIRYPTAGSRDTSWFPPRPTEEGGNYIECQIAGGGIRFFAPPFSPPSLLVPLADGRLMGLRGGDYRLAEMRSGGDTTAVIERRVDRAPISDDEWREGTAEWEGFKAANGEGGCRGSMTRPAAKPAVRDLLVDDAGRVWAERIMATGHRWEVWDGGQLVAAVDAPVRDAGVPVEVTRDHFIFAREHSDGGHEVVVTRLSGR